MITTLSLHITSKCNLNCPFCYRIKDNIHTPPNWLLDIPKIARDLGITQIPVGGGEPTFYPKFLDKFTKNCQNNDILPNLTSNGYNILSLSEQTLNRFGCISLSFDKYKIRQIGLTKYTYLIAKLRVKISTVTKLGINYLILDRDSLYYLPACINYFNRRIDYFYILQLKNYPLDYSAKDLKRILYPLIALLGDRIFVDDSIQLFLNKKEYCSRGNELVTLYPDGSICPCSFSTPIAKIKTAQELREIINSYYPLNRTSVCPYLMVS